MSKQSIVLLTSTEGQLNVTGEAYKAAGYFGYSSGIHTACWYMTDFVGKVYIEASLATNPTASDWSTVYTKQYPVDPQNPTGNYSGDTGLDNYTFQSNIVWVRARVDRSYLVNPDVLDVGSIQKILLNY